MPVSVEIPEIGEVEFPDSMSDADIAAASGKLFTQKTGVPPIPAPLAQPPAPQTPELARELAETERQLFGMPVGFEPSIRLPKYETPPLFPGQEPPKTLEVGGGIYNALAGAAESLTTPESAMTMGLAGAPRAIGRLGHGIWAAFMAKGVPEQVQEARKAFKEGKPLSEKIEKTLAPIIASAFAVSGAREALRPEPMLTPEQVAKAQEQARVAGLPSQEPFPESPKAPETPAVVPEPVPPPETSLAGQPERAVSVPEQPVKPAEAIPEAQAVVSEAVRTQGKRSAQEIKNELVAEIQDRLQKAPSEAVPGDKVTIEIPDDGTFVIPNTVEALSEVLKRAKAIKVKEKPPGVSKAAIKASANAIRQTYTERPTRPSADKPTEAAASSAALPEQPVKAADVEQRAMLSGSHIAGIPDPISLAFAVTFGTKTGRQIVGDAVRFYSEPLSERLATEGTGPNAKGFATMSKEIAQRAKELYGSLTEVLDPALEAMGKMNRTTTWLNDIAPTQKRWGFRNAQAAVEGPIDNVPPQYRANTELLKVANLRIGQLAERVVHGFKATGRYQRPPTDFLIDTIRSGQGQAFDIVKNALAAENKIHPDKVKNILLEIKEQLDAPGSEQTVHKIAQEFERHFKKFPTDIRITTPVGEVWMPILHAKPFEYLQNAATRTAQRVAFLERVPKDSLPEIRKAVVSELKSPEAFDDLVRALHGLPVNQPLRFFPPGSLQSMIAQGANRVLTDVFGTLKLTASAIYNIPETVLGNTPAFFGWRNFARGAIELKQRWAKLEELGAINRNIYNFSFDPKAPIRSILNDFRLGVRKVTMQQFFNEMQEMLAASTAQVFAERAGGKLLSPREQGLFTETAVAMGFTRPAAKAMAEGRGTTEQYGNFTRRAAAFATGGNIQPAEMSRFGGNRVLSSLFRFQSYPIMKLNAFRKAYMNFSEAVESKDPRRIKASSEQLAKFLFNTTAQGAAAAFLAALLSGRGGGVQQTAQEAEDNSAKFILDSLMGGMGGPVSAINYTIGTGKSRDLLDPRKINAGITFPGSIYLELKQLFNREGPYAGMTLQNATQKYLETRVPAGKIFRHALEEAGLASKGDTVGRNIYRIHQDWLKRHPDESVRKDYEREQQQVYGESKYSAVYAAIRSRDLGGLEKAISDLESKGTDIKAIKEAIKTNLQPGKRLFRGKKELEDDFVNSLTPEQLKTYEAALDERQEQWDFLDENF